MVKHASEGETTYIRSSSDVQWYNSTTTDGCYLQWTYANLGGDRFMIGLLQGGRLRW